jgi:hypothetical protein
MKPRLFGLLLATLAAATMIPGLQAANATAVDTETVQELIREAEAARSRAASLGAEWLETRKLIAEARQLAESGDLQQAAQRAEEARQQGELAAAQAERESTAWQRRVVQ